MTQPANSAALAARGPVLTTERSLTPDLARGAMLLFIALANAPGLAAGTPVDAAHFSGMEQVATFFMSTFVHARAYPVFAIMFGYGLVQLALRQQAAGATNAGVRAVLLRRNAWLIVFGFFHAALLYFADFLGAYGLIGIAATLFLLNSERVQRVLLWFWILPVIEMLVLAVLIGVGLSNGAGTLADVQVAPVASAVAPSYIDSIIARLSEWSMHTATILPAIFIVNLGMWAARRRMLEDLESHARLLRWVACGSLAIAFIGGLPHTFVTLGMLHADEQTAMFINILHKVSGMFGGPGYIALIGLIALRLSRSNRGAMRTGISGAMVALGQRSLSGYLLQSIAWLLVFSPYTLRMGSRFDSAFITSLVLALIVWMATLFGAALCQKLSYRGPAEILLRRLAYGSQYRRTPAELKVAETV